jgi:hypothetical protein
MALGPISSLGAPVQPAPARDVTNAQRAFFQAALGKAEPMAAIETATPQLAVAPEPEPAKAAAQADAPKTGYRPGSLLDLRV